jgi:hypothetical protein
VQVPPLRFAQEQVAALFPGAQVPPIDLVAAPLVVATQPDAVNGPAELAVETV